MERFLDMTEARNRHDFLAAHEHMQAYYALNNALTDYELEVDPDNANWIRLGRDARLVNRRERSDSRGNYFDRFFSSPVRSGFARTQEIGEPEEGLPGVPGSFRPFDLPATRAVRLGAENWVVVKIENRSLSELGTGGILAPVMFWSPRDPDWQP